MTDSKATQLIHKLGSIETILRTIAAALQQMAAQTPHR